mmetsp:Transcript_32239/g.50270  ORF Transcript_32239/g.50270 Transcript_32239/m.50270 type:complete len:359 (-) Transcript_32239:406-1482(-)
MGVSASNQQIQVHVRLLGALWGPDRNDGNILVHAVQEVHILVVLGVVLPGTKLKSLSNQLGGAVDGLKPGLLVCPVVKPDQVDVELQSGAQLLALVSASIVAFDIIRDLLHCFSAPRAFAHDVHVHFQDLLALGRRGAGVWGVVCKGLINSSLDLPAALDIRNSPEAVVLVQAVLLDQHVCLAAGVQDLHLILGRVLGWDKELRHIEMRTLGVEVPVRPLASVDSVGGYDVVDFPSKHDGVMVGCNCLVLLLELRVLVEQVEVSFADRAGIDVVNHVKQTLEGSKLLLIWVLGKVDGGGVDVSPERPAQHSPVRGKVEHIPLGPVLVDKTASQFPAGIQGLQDLLLQVGVERLKLEEA